MRVLLLPLKKAGAKKMFHLKKKNENRELLLVSGRKIRRTKKPLVGEKMFFWVKKGFSFSFIDLVSHCTYVSSFGRKSGRYSNCCYFSICEPRPKLAFFIKKKSQVAPNLISKNAKLDRSTSRVVLFIGILTAVAGGFVRQSTGRGHKMFVLANSSFIQQTHVSKTQHMYGPDS
jgi:hypothetical protein